MADEKLKKLRKDYMKAKKDKSPFVSTYNTLIGDYETQSKRGDMSGKEPDDIVELVADKTIKNLKKYGTEEAEKEIEVVQEYATEGLSSEEEDKLIDEVIEENNELVEEIQAGNSDKVKKLLGQVMKKAQGKADPTSIDEKLRDKMVV